METSFWDFVLSRPQGIIRHQASEEDVTGGIATVSYVAGEDGKQELKSGIMWYPVNIVNRQAWDEIDRRVELTREKIAAGKMSCLCYYMVINHMDTGLLAKYTGQSRLVVFLHTIPFFFKRLGVGTLQKYAEIFAVEPEDLRQGRLGPPVYDTSQGKQHAGH